MGSQAGKAYRLVLQEHDACYSVLALLLAFVTPSHKRKGEELPSEKLRRLSSPRHWDVALVPFPEDFVPLPRQPKPAWRAQRNGPDTMQKGGKNLQGPLFLACSEDRLEW